MDSVIHFAGLITSYNMLDAVVRGMVTPPAEVALTNTNTIGGVLCISDTSVWCLVVNSWGETVHAYSTVSKEDGETFILGCYIWTLYYIRTGMFIRTF